MSDNKDILLEKVREFEKRTGHTVDSFPDDPNNTASVLKERRYLSEPMTAEEASRRMFMKTLIGGLIGGLAAWTTVLSLRGLFGFQLVSDETKTALYKGAFEFNERVSQIFYSPKRLAAEFPEARVTIPARFNGAEGLDEVVDVAAWRLRVGGLAGMTQDLVLTLDDIKRLPRTEMTTEFKCIEGWGTIVHWAGVRFSDFLEDCLEKAGIGIPYESKFLVNVSKYVSLTTPDEKYFVGWDMESILHPQTLLAYEMNGAPLTNEHGAPLRLASPTKYGIKQIKRISRIEFTDERPADFWAQPEYGYDWYSGH